MSTFKARGIVLKEIMVGESDKIVTLLLKDIGKLSVSAKGARKAKSKFLAGTQQFTYSDFVIYDGGKFYSMAQIDVLENFYEVRQDFLKLCYGNYFLELCDKIILSGEPCNEILLLLLKTLAAMTKSKVQPQLAGRVFELKFLQLNGFAPEVASCAYCESSGNVFYMGGNGVVCSNCRSNEPRAFKISQQSLHALEYILSNEVDKLYKFSAENYILSELEKAAELSIDSHFEVNIKSRELLD